MRKYTILSILGALCFCLTGCSAQGGSTIFMILGILALALAALRTYGSIQYSRSRKRNRRRKPEPTEQILFTVILYVLALVLFLAAAVCGGNDEAAPQAHKPSANITEPSEPAESTPVESSFSPAKVGATDPGNWGIQWEIFQGSTQVQDYTRPAPIFFGQPEDYFALPGIATFRGNNYRNSPSYGTANVSQQTLKKNWSVQTGNIAGGRWGGCGWTGQPLIVQWDAQTRSNMNLYPEKKAKADLVEVIYATLDGKIYFLDMEDGSATRKPIDMGMCFKGAGSLDPRGYPLLYVGSGDVNADGKRPRMFIISLIDGKVLYEYGYDEALSLRTDNDRWCAFDSTPLIHAATDTLIWPGESGVLYTMTLNTKYDAQAGTISIAPDNMVRTRYSTTRSNSSAYWYGYECGANIVGNYLYTSENGGMFFCIDLNTMELVWAQDTKDDSNSTPVFEHISDQEAYIYTAPSLHWTKDANSQGTIHIYKLNALTGEIIWKTPFDVHTVSGVSGGIQSSPVLGKPGTELEGLILYTVARTPNVDSGVLVALDTETGKEVWSMDMRNYAWSSPAPIYTASGKGYIVVCDSVGYMFLLDGKTGRQLHSLTLGGMVEASPAVFNNKIVVGVKRGPICCIEIE